MKSFLIDLAGAIFIVAIAALSLPLYANYQARNEVKGWLSQLETTRHKIAAQALQHGSLQGAGVGITPPYFEGIRPNLIRIEADGNILLRGGSTGQMLVLIPALSTGTVSWTCVGGPDDAVPDECRNILPTG
jgi:Tfp pilus assembly major pilin PilA